MTPRLALLAAGLAAAAPVHGAPNPQLAADLAALQALDTRIQSIGWKLVRGNARFCRDVAPGIGLQLFDAAGFADPAAVRAALGLPGDIAVEAAADNSPAERAGLRTYLPLASVAGQPVAQVPVKPANDYARLAALHDRVDAALLATGRVEFVADDGRAIAVAGEPTCVTRFELLSGGSRASADGKRVVIGRKLVEELGEESLIAAALAHELAHNLLGHRARLDASGRSWGKVKATEREADRLAPWLLANAGYDPAAAVRFFQTWGPRHDLGILSTPDHDRWQTRAKRVAAELPKIAAGRAADGSVDWRSEFPPGR